MIKITRILLITLLLITSINALISGFLFIVDPTGKLIGMTTDYLKASPFTSFLIPGIVLFTVNGIMNLVAGVALIKRKPYASYLTIFTGNPPCRMDYYSGFDCQRHQYASHFDVCYWSFVCSGRMDL